MYFYIILLFYIIYLYFLFIYLLNNIISQFFEGEFVMITNIF